MKAWQFVGAGRPLALNEVAEPVASPGSLVIDVKAAGLCHSDVSYLDGTLTLLPFSPITLGHEIVGVVSQVGADVDQFTVGDRVGIPAAIESPGTSSDGGFAPKVLVAPEFVISLPDGAGFEQAAAATDAGMTSYHAIMDRGQVQQGMKVGIIGFGGLGSLGAQTAIAQGAAVYVAETNPEVHDYARGFGIDHIAAEISAFADEDLDVIIDFAGFETTTSCAVMSVRRGGRVVRVGLAREMGLINLNLLTLNSVELVGSQAGTKQDCAAVLDLIASGKLASRISTISFEKIGEGMERLERGEVVGRLVAVYD